MLIFARSTSFKAKTTRHYVLCVTLGECKPLLSFATGEEC
ncbi:Uncharacterised protein [Paucimonas lemoignei]|nr:Uncharacterised protein [Paucimonas lemoignei]